MGYRKHLSALPALVTMTLAVAACGSSHATSSSSSSTPTPSPAQSSPSAAPATSPPATAGTRLTVSYVAAPGAKAQVWTLTCDPTGGDHPAATQSCALLSADASKGIDPFAPVRKGIMCTMIDAGPQISTVTGTWQGRQINTSFDRKNGCQTARWNRASPLVGGKIFKP